MNNCSIFGHRFARGITELYCTKCGQIIPIIQQFEEIVNIADPQPAIEVEVGSMDVYPPMTRAESDVTEWLRTASESQKEVYYATNGQEIQGS